MTFVIIRLSECTDSVGDSTGNQKYLITWVIGTKFLSEQVAKTLENTVGTAQNVPIKICA